MQYLLLNLVVISIPLAFSWHPKLRFAQSWRSFWPACLIVLTGFIVWDIAFTSWGVWGFNADHLVGLSVWGLPIEEWLFFICIPYACVFTYFAFRVKRTSPLGVKGRGILAFLGLVALVIGLLNYDKWYTVTATIPCAILIAYWLWKQPFWLGTLMKTFIVLFPAFVLTNGILTGLSFWEWSLINSNPEQISNFIVWYDNTQNLGIRLFSVPFDDFFYGFLLIGLNVTVFEAFQKRRGSAGLVERG